MMGWECMGCVWMSGDCDELHGISWEVNREKGFNIKMKMEEMCDEDGKSCRREVSGEAGGLCD